MISSIKWRKLSGKQFPLPSASSMLSYEEWLIHPRRRAYARDEVTKERYFEYLVKWVGWGMKDSTW